MRVPAEQAAVVGCVHCLHDSHPAKVMDDFCGGHGVIPKPFSRNGLQAAMRYIEEGSATGRQLAATGKFYRIACLCGRWALIVLKRLTVCTLICCPTCSS